MFDDSARLRVKPIYPVYRLDQTTFRIGAQRGFTREFRDPLGQLWQLVHLADGTRRVPELVEAMRLDHPGLTGDDIRAGLAHLDGEGLVEDARLNDDSSADRFAGTVNHFRHYTGIDAEPRHHLDVLQASRVTLLGLGGGGSTILPLLVALGVGTITALDYDRVELSNLNRQFLYRESDVGELKTRVAQRTVAELNSSTRFHAVQARVESADDVLPHVRDVDLVICAIDEPPFLAQRRVNAACVEAGVSCLFGGSQVTRGRMFTVVPGVSGCFDCLHVHYTKTDPKFGAQFAGFHDLNFDPPTIAFPPDILRLGSAITGEAARLLTGYQPPVSVGTQFEIDFAGGGVEVVTQWPRYPDDCPTCGAGDEADYPAFAAYRGELWRDRAPATEAR